MGAFHSQLDESLNHHPTQQQQVKLSLDNLSSPIASIKHLNSPNALSNPSTISALASIYAKPHNTAYKSHSLGLKSSSHPNLPATRFTKYPNDTDAANCSNTAATPRRSAAGMRRIHSSAAVSSKDNDAENQIEYTICKNCAGNCMGRVLSPNGELFCSGDCYFSFAFRQAESIQSINSTNDDKSTCTTVSRSQNAFAAAGENSDSNETDEDIYFNFRKLQKNFKIVTPGNEAISNPIAIPSPQQSNCADLNSLLYN
jgi:hypothetical protein